MYTLELYKADARTKSGERLVEKRDGCGALGSPKLACELHYAKMYPAPKWRVEIQAAKHTGVCKIVRLPSPRQPLELSH